MKRTKQNEGGEMKPKCVPLENGYYWATDRIFERRVIIEVAFNGHKHRRVYSTRDPGSRDITDFEKFVGPLKEIDSHFPTFSFKVATMKRLP